MKTSLGVQKEYMPFHNRETKDFAKMRRYLLKMFANDDFTQLNKEFDMFRMSFNSLEHFFNQEGYDILTWLLRVSKNNKSLQFITDNVPSAILQSAIKNNDFINLKQFLNGRAALEEFGKLTPELRILDQERFKFLLMVDSGLVQDFMTANKATGIITQSTWEDYELALKSLEQYFMSCRYR